MANFDQQHDERYLDRTFSALSDPTRRAILQRLASGDASVNELAQPFDVSLPAISRHLKILQEAGLVQRRREGKYRPCQLDGRALMQAANWINTYRQFWGDQFDRLAQFLEESDPALEKNQPGRPDPAISNDNKEK